jgi:hypothetical protein
VTAPLTVADLADYLANTGWRATTRSWRGARIWIRDVFEVLVPTREDLGDNDARIRDALQTVAAAETRTLAEIYRDILNPAADSATYRIASDGIGSIRLLDGVETVAGLRDLVGVAARVVVEGPHLRFTGRAPAAIDAFLGRIELAQPQNGELNYTLLIPAQATDDGLRGRDVMVQLHDAASAVEEAVRVGDVAAFDDTVTAGVSAQFCAALSTLAGADRREPFELGFRWGHSLPSQLPPRTLPFLPDAGVLVRAASVRLRRLRVSGMAVAVGTVDGQHDEAGGTDRWRVRVRGELRTGGRDEPTGPRRAIWARLPDQDTYDRALEAYRASQHLRVEGELTSRDGRLELSTPAEGIELMNDRGPEGDRAH